MKGSGATEADWSPDGRKIVFQLDPRGRAGCHVALMNTDGSGLVDLTGEAERLRGSTPALTADGRRIVFGRYDDKIEIESLEHEPHRGRSPPVTPRKRFGPATLPRRIKPTRLSQTRSSRRTPPDTV